MNKPSKVRGFLLFFLSPFCFFFSLFKRSIRFNYKKNREEKKQNGGRKKQNGERKKQNGERKSENSRTFKCHFNTFFFALLFLVEKAHLRQKCVNFHFFLFPTWFFLCPTQMVCQKVVYTGLKLYPVTDVSVIL